MEDMRIRRLDGWEPEDCFKDVFLNRYGYYELREKNTQKERQKNFSEEYFQEYSGATYAKEYPASELAFIRNKIEERAFVIEQNLARTGGLKEGSYSLLGIGCGEGFLLQYFYEKGVTVKGIDIGSYALEHFHPEMLSFFEKGDMETLVPAMALKGEHYDVINMDRILDMVLDPEECIRLVKGLMTEESLLVVKVANNYSYLQQMLMESGDLQKDYWLDAPDHTGYFNREGMIRLLKSQGLVCADFYGDTFVDFQLLNPYTNYYEKPEVGKEAHRMAVRMENMLHDISMEQTVEVYRILGNMGFGREIVGVFRKTNRENR